MQHEILYKPAYTLLEVKLEAGERIEAEEGQEGEEAWIFHNKRGLYHSAWQFTENLVSNR